jgi:signal transduction histidine kinase/DNA-binding response OmpR family regulator
VDEIEKNLENNESYTVNVVCRIDGDIYYKRFTYYAVDKDTKFYLLLKSDVTDVLRHEHEQNEILADALKSAEQANAAKTSFLSNMSHEIRTPMNAIIGLNSIALRDKDLSQQTRDYLIKIGESAGHLLNLINDILDMSRIESGRMTLRKEEFLFGSVIEQIKIMTQSQCRDKGLEFEFINSCDPEEWYFGDDTKLKQIIINILSNAIKFTNPPGKVTFMVEKVAYFDSQSTIRFTIKDTGIGMDESFLPNIFDAFTQEDSSRSNRYGSTGLGMAITKNIVEMMNGSITVDSKKGVGSTFKVTVTLKDCDRPGNKKEFDPNLVKALVIDDDEIALKNTSLVLENIGISCDTVASGAEALKAMEINHAKHEPYNLVFVDWKMPDRNGLDITREINKEYRDEAKIIMLTAYSGDDIMEDAIAAGADGFITKSAFSTIAKSEIKKVMLREKKRIKQKTDLCGKHILLAEDMQINAEIITQVLALKGMDVVHTENGREAFETFKNSKPGTFDAVLMDVRMPEMDGLESTVAIRGLDRVDARKIPIIALTANAFDEDVKRSLQVGMNAHLSKPVEPSRLYSTLEELID